MATFPATFGAGALLPVVCEMYVGGDWHDVTSDVLTRDNGNITITRGLSNEATSITPSQAQFQFNNRVHAGESGSRYSPNDPMGPWYGSIGRNNPVRITMAAEKDTFARTVSGGWGINDSGDTWAQLAWVGSGNSAATSYSVNGSAGLHTNGASGFSYVLSGSANTYTDLDVAVTVSVLPGTPVTGGNVEPANIIFRAQSATQYYMVRCALTPANPPISPFGTVTLQLMDYNGTAISAAVTAAVTHSVSSLRVRAQVEGQTLRAKVWDASGTEPAGWLVVGNYMDAVISSGAQQWDGPGWFGIRSGIASGNTNTLPVVFSYTNLTVRVPRYAGGVVSLVPTSDVSGVDKYLSATAASVLRQLNQGSLPLKSCLRHDIPTLPWLVAYWPCEDGTAATTFGSAFLGGTPMTIIGSPQFASDSTFVGSAPLPVVNGSYWLGYVNSSPNTGSVQVRMLVKFPPAATLTDGTVIYRFWTYGTVQRWDVIYYAGGRLGVSCYDSSGNLINATGAIGFTVDGVALWLGVWLQKSGSNISCQLSVLPQLVGGTATYWAFTVTGQTITTCYAVAVGPPGNNLASTVVGHITVEAAATDIFALLNQLNAFNNEDASARLARLCSYFGIEYNYVGDPHAKPIKMGAQPIDTLLNLITACATTDGGLLYEARGSQALVYRTTGGHLNPAGSQVALDAAQHQLSAWPQVTYDDLQLHNDVIAQRPNGSQYEAILKSGPLSTQAPPNGVGQYSTTLSVNPATDTMLTQIAQWALYLSTVADARYPQVSLNMGSAHLTGVTNGSTALWWAILSIDPDDFATVAGLSADTVTLLVRGYTEVMTGLSYTFVWNCAPGAPYRVGTASDGATRADSSTTTLHAAITSTATSMQVDVADGVLWTRDSTQWPFDVACEGERITVTAVIGSSSPQTFTITRSVNGIVKAHPTTGVSVSLFTPYYAGMGG